jgi:hypothetical protein
MLIMLFNLSLHAETLQLLPQSGTRDLGRDYYGTVSRCATQLARCMWSTTFETHLESMPADTWHSSLSLVGLAKVSSTVPVMQQLNEPKTSCRKDGEELLGTLVLSIARLDASGRLRSCVATAYDPTS